MTTAGATQLGSIAEWVAGFRAEQAPARLRPLLHAQTLSVAAATLSGRASEDGAAVNHLLDRAGGAGDLPLPGGGTAPLLSALDAVSSWSMAQDYDDYLFMGHTGHSAIWVPLYVGAWLKSEPTAVAAAMLVANELGGRLGTSLLLGPHNGQMWVPIHRIAAAAATAKLLGLDATRIAHAMAIALYEANDPVFHGFMGPGSKVRSASGSVVAGVQAALLAEGGLTGAPDLLEHARGFWNRFTFAPLKGTFRGLGQSWVLDTIAIKPVPGCAYVDTTVDAVERIQRQYLAERGAALEPFLIDRVHVEAGILTVGMNALSRGAVKAGALSPVVVNFSIPLTVASMFALGGLDGSRLTQRNLDEHRDQILEIADHVTLRHSGARTLHMVRGIDDVLPLTSWLDALTLKQLLGLRGRARREVGGDVDRAVFDGGFRRGLAAADRAFLRQRVLRPAVAKLFEPLYGHPPKELPLETVDFTKLQLRFPAEVTIVLRSGERLRAESPYPPGTSADGTQLDVAHAKWAREAGRFLTAPAVAAFAAAAGRSDTAPGELLRLLADAANAAAV